jgi:hypothetical protein
MTHTFDRPGRCGPTPTAFEAREALGEIGACFGGRPLSEIAMFQ